MLAAAFLVTACGGNGDGPVRLTITSPNDGAMISVADDENDGLPGIQISVLVGAVNLDAGEELKVFVDTALWDQGDRETEWALRPPGELLAEDGSVLFTNQPLNPGTIQITVCARGCADSATVEVTVEAPMECPSVTFVNPPAAPPGGVLVLGPSEDTDGTQCGETFTTDVRVSTNAPTGSTAQLYVNGLMVGAPAPISGLVAAFSDVVLDRRTPDLNSIEVEIISASLPTCDRVAYSGQVEVDCDGVTCQITAPDASRTYLTSADDSSTDDDFQTDFVVSSEADAVGETLRLVVDGDEAGALGSAAVAAGMGAEATFGPVTLTEGTHRAQGICQDSSGNLTRSAVAEWIVDITACDAVLTTPVVDTLFIDADDLDGSTAGIQVDVAGTVSGTGCASVQVGVCDSALTDATLDTSAFTGVATLPTTDGTHELCASVTDDAGNVSVSAPVTVVVATDAPMLRIVSPVPGAAGVFYNVAGTVDGAGEPRIADLDPGTTACEAAFTVNCSEADLTVELVRADTMGVIATATCATMAGLPAGFVGQATFPMAPLPSVNAVASYNVLARATSMRLMGASAVIAVTADCQAPELLISRPAGCFAAPFEDVLRPGIDDEDAAAGLQYAVNIVNANSPAPCVDLAIGGSMEPTSCVRTGAANIFVNADFGAGGDLAVEATAMDAGGNTGLVTCSVRVADLPTVNITSPADGARLGAADDCDPGTPGMQILITGTTDAPAATASVTVAGGASQSISLTAGGPGSTFSECVDASDFNDQPVVVTIDRGGDVALGTINISVDSAAPDMPITTLEVVTTVDRRGGEVRFRWTDVDDAAGAGPLARYEMRCADAAISDEAEWAAARAFPITRVPMSAGTISTEDISGFRITQAFECMVRGVDGVGQLSPLGNTVPVQLDFLEQAVTMAGSASLGEGFAAIGDVNGDGIDDVLVSASPSISAGNTAFLYFGSTTGLPSSPSVTIRGELSFGVAVAGLGDFNDDGMNDFVIGSPRDGGFAGRTFVFYGKALGDPWDAIVDVSPTTSCEADICISASGLSLLGRSVSSAGDFDGDGIPDLLIGRPRTGDGVAYVVLGGDIAAGTQYQVPGDVATAPDGFVISPPAGVGRFGTAVTTLGDVGSDGRADLAISASGIVSSGVLGSVLTVPGTAYAGSGLVPLVATVLATGAAGEFGVRMTNAGDVDRNGQMDIAVYSSIGTQGRVHVYLGMGGTYDSSNEIVYLNDLASPAANFFGNTLGVAHVPALGVLGDLDGDGFSDLLTGSSARSTGQGSVEIFFGSLSTADRNRSAANASYQPGAVAAGVRTAGYVGDVNGDGSVDFAIGDPAGNSGEGEFWVRY